MEPYYLVPMFLKFHRMIVICDTYILYVFPNISNRLQDFSLDRKVGLLHDKLYVYVFFRDAVALFTKVFHYLNPKRCLRKEVSVAQFLRYTNT